MAESNDPGGSPTIFCSNCGAAIEGTAQFCPSCGAANLRQPGGNIAAGAPPRRTDHIKYRNMVMQVILFIITLSIYGIYWFHVTLNELYRANGNEEGSGCLWTILYLIPIAQFFAYWHHSNQYARFTNNKYPGIAIFILWLVFSPVVWFLVQSDLNRAARSNTSPCN